MTPSWYERVVRLWRSRSPREWFFGPVYLFLRSWEERAWLRIIGAAFFLVGVGLSTYNAVVYPGRIRMPEYAVETRSIRGYGDSFHGGSNIIEVNGAQYECRSSDYLVEYESRVPVLYDPTDPSHCRRASLVGRLSRWEWLSIIESAGMLLLGLSLVLIEKDDTNRLRFYVSHILLAAMILLVFASLPVQVAANSTPDWVQRVKEPR